jgi:tubulin--tyrosine ligase-like protein 12
MNSFDDYNVHFTVMNYRDDPLEHIECVDFIPMFEQQYPDHPWPSIQDTIFQSIHELFTGATIEEPPAGIGHFPQSRAMYAVDLMLEWTTPTQDCGCRSIQPKLLEINFCPDCHRACQYHPSFFNDVFECLFIPESQHNPNLPVTRITGTAANC